MKVTLFILIIAALIGAGVYRSILAQFRSDVFTDRDDATTDNPERDHE